MITSRTYREIFLETPSNRAVVKRWLLAGLADLGTDASIECDELDSAEEYDLYRELVEEGFLEEPAAAFFSLTERGWQEAGKVITE